jgi:NADP-dependent 3-hydroxy acid dehydrogenase YdfG
VTNALQGRAAWITGAGSGIGRAIALAFAGAGTRVALTGRRADALAETASLVREQGGEAVEVVADVTDADSVADAHRRVVAALGDPHLLVNNAGGNARRRHWHQLSPGDMGWVLDVNLRGPFLCSIAVLPAMRERRDGLLIHVASLAATGTFTVAGPAYGAAKHGARAMSASINAEEGIHGIRSVCINPGEVATPILDSRAHPPSAEERAIMVQPEDVAACALFAASLPPRTCLADMIVVPTDSSQHRATARAIERMQG